jgi:hypothetical protein
MNRFRFTPNVPAIISLAQSEGAYDSEAGTVAYQLSDGREMVVNTEFATRINLLDLQPGESFGVCKRVTEDRHPPYFDVWLSPATEQERAKQEAEAVPVAPLAVPQRKGATRVREMPPAQPAAQPRLFDQRGTGTYGPAPRMQPAPATRQVPAPPIPFNQAFIEAVKIVRDGLKEAGVQWGDGPQQDAVSTILIGALNRNWIGPWERQQ